MILSRPRRLRKTSHLRELVHETSLSLKQLIQPYFLSQNKGAQEPIKGFTGTYRWGIDLLSRRIETDIERGLRSFLLFGTVEEGRKDNRGEVGSDVNGSVPSALRILKKRFGNESILFTDVCLCPYSSDGHCGIVKNENIENDHSLEALSRMALTHAEAGADFVAPSDMMDGRVQRIRERLDLQGFDRVGILSYTAKFASNYYGPFREALGSSPKGTDRASYQMDYRNSKESLRELKLDLAEGADMVMVKPALAYLDIIHQFKQNSDVPVAAYSVSSEYEMVKLLSEKGLCDEKTMALENLTAIKRAGADIIITYFASEAAEKGWLK